jgi:spermidine synthase
MTTPARVPVAALLLMAASGFAGIGYQIVWTQQGALWMGHEAAAVLAVVTAFFGGLGLGALVLGPRIAASARPVRWYCACEAAIGAWGLALVLLMPWASAALAALTGPEPGPVRQWTIAFCGSFVLLLPATAAMGATVPAMLRLVARLGAGARSIGALYAANTAGAVLGVLACAFWLVPAFGLARATLVCVALNLACAALAWRLAGTAVDEPDTAAAHPGTDRATLVRLAASGFLGIAYEVMVVRVLAQVAEDTVYTFALLLAVYLVGTALGAALWARWRTPASDARRRLFALLSAACLAGSGSLWAAAALKAAVAGVAGPGLATALAAEAVLALAAFALPTVAMGALFSQLCEEAQAAGVDPGRAMGVNTLGCAAAPLVFGVVVTPLAGPAAALLAIVAGYLLLATGRARPPALAWAVGAATAAVALWAPPLAFVDVPEGGRVASYREGVMAAVAVVADDDGVLRLRINDRQQEGSSATRLVDSRQALLPLLLHPDPHRALFLGLGTGVTATAAARDPSLQVDAVELLPEVVEASALFRDAAGADLAGTRLHVLAADARRYVRATDRRYDVIVSDNFHPARSGSAALYTVEHFEAVRARLADGGVFCQWLPLHQLDLATLRSIVASFVAVFPHGDAILASNSLATPVLGLVARAGGGRFELAAAARRIAASRLPEPPAAFGIVDEYALLGSVVAGPAALARFARGAPLNTDDHPVVATLAPRATYAPEASPAGRLAMLLRELSVEPAEIVADDPASPPARRLAAYWLARDRFIALGRQVTPSADPARMLAQVRDPLLSVLRESPDFRPAYDPLLRMATALARTDAAAARTLLADLRAVQPARVEAGEALESLAH